MKRINEDKLEKTLCFIQSYQLAEGKAPNYRQIKEACDFSSLATVRLYLERLKERGLIDLDSKGGWNKILIPENLRRGETHNAAIVGDVRCGQPSPAIEDIECSVSLPNEIFGNAEHIILHAKGPSMINRGIFDGDLLVVRRQPTAEVGDTIIAMLNNSEESTCKILDKKKGRYYLRAANDTIDEKTGKRLYDVYPKGNFEIYGVVDYVIHAP